MANIAGMLPVPPILLPVHELPVGDDMHVSRAVTLSVREVQVVDSHFPARTLGIDADPL